MGGPERSTTTTNRPTRARKPAGGTTRSVMSRPGGPSAAPTGKRDSIASNTAPDSGRAERRTTSPTAAACTDRSSPTTSTGEARGPTSTTASGPSIQTVASRPAAWAPSGVGVTTGATAAAAAMATAPTRSHLVPTPRQGRRGRHDREVAEIDVAERERRAERGDRFQGPEPDRARHVQQAAAGAADQPGQRAGPQPPHHQRTGDRAGRDVGRECGERHRAEHGDQHRRDGELRTGGDAEPLAEPARSGQAARDAGREEEDTGGRRHREAEPERVDEERIDQQEQDDGDAQVPRPTTGSARGPGEQGHRGHERGPEHGRLEPGDERERGNHGHGEHEPGPDPEALQHRADHDQHERHVLARHGEQVGEAGGAEVGGELGRLGAVIAEHEAGEQGPTTGRQGDGAAVEQAAIAVGGPRRHRAVADGFDRLDDHAAGEVARHRPFRGVAEGTGRAGDPGAVTGQAGRQRGDGLRRAHLGEEPTTIGVGFELEPAVDGGGRVGEDGDDPAERADRRRVQPRLCPVGEHAREQQQAETERHRATESDRDDETRDHHPDREAGGEDRTDPGRDRRRHRPSVRHGPDPGSGPTWPRRCLGHRAVRRPRRTARSARGGR